jgi:hypothetical protein
MFNPVRPGLQRFPTATFGAATHPVAALDLLVYDVGRIS